MKKTLIERIEVGAGGAASIEFTSIPQDGVDLLVVYSVRDSAGAGWFRLNGDATAGNHVNLQLRGTGTAVGAYLNTGYTGIPLYPTETSMTANTFGSVACYINNYTSSLKKSISVDNVYENNAANAFQLIMANKYSGTSPVTSLVLASQGTIQQYSTASLYKISA